VELSLGFGPPIFVPIFLSLSSPLLTTFSLIDYPGTTIYRSLLFIGCPFTMRFLPLFSCSDASGTPYSTAGFHPLAAIDGLDMPTSSQLLVVSAPPHCTHQPLLPNFLVSNPISPSAIDFTSPTSLLPHFSFSPPHKRPLQPSFQIVRASPTAHQWLLRFRSQQKKTPLTPLPR